MKRKVITCDLCGADITGANTRYKFKEYEHNYCNQENPDWAKWGRCDMCLMCYFDLLRFVSDRRKRGDANE